jgi:hypothetical protein
MHRFKQPTEIAQQVGALCFTNRRFIRLKFLGFRWTCRVPISIEHDLTTHDAPFMKNNAASAAPCETTVAETILFLSVVLSLCPPALAIMFYFATRAH